MWSQLMISANLELELEIQWFWGLLFPGVCQLSRGAFRLITRKRTIGQQAIYSQNPQRKREIRDGVHNTREQTKAQSNTQESTSPNKMTKINREPQCYQEAQLNKFHVVSPFSQNTTKHGAIDECIDFYKRHSEDGLFTVQHSSHLREGSGCY